MEFLVLKHFKISSKDTQAGWFLSAPGWTSGSAVTSCLQQNGETPLLWRNLEARKSSTIFPRISLIPVYTAFFSPFLLGIKGSKILNIMTMCLPGSKSVSNIVLEQCSHLESPEAGLWSFLGAHSTN